MDNIEKTISSVMVIHYYYFVILAILNALFIFFDINLGYKITTVIMAISIILQILIGYVHGILGLPSIVIIIGASIFFTKEIWLGTSSGLSIIGIINFIANEIFNKIIHLIARLASKV